MSIYKTDAEWLADYDPVHSEAAWLKDFEERHNPNHYCGECMGKTPCCLIWECKYTPIPSELQEGRRNLKTPDVVPCMHCRIPIRGFLREHKACGRCINGGLPYDQTPGYVLRSPGYQSCRQCHGPVYTLAPPNVVLKCQKCVGTPHVH